MRFSLKVMAGLLLGVVTLQAGSVSSLETRWAEGSLWIKVYAPGVTKIRTLFLKHQTPKMLVVDFLNARYRLAQRHYPVKSAQGVLGIRGSQFRLKPQPVARLVVDLTDSLPYQISQKADTVVLQIQTARGAARQVEVFTTFQARGGRDPFTPWFQKQREDTLFNPLRGQLVGILVADNGLRYALVQEGNKPGFILKKGDRVSNGVVLAVTAKSVIFYVKDRGVPRRIVLTLEKQGKKGRSS